MNVLAYLVAGMAVVGCKNDTIAHFKSVAEELSAAEAAAVKAGVPLQARDLAPPKLRPEDNAAPLLDKAKGELSKIKVPKGKDIFSLSLSTLEPDVLLLRDLLRQAEPAFELLAEASSRSAVDFGRNWDTDRPWDMLFPEYAILRNNTKWTSTAALIAARNGDSARAIRDLDSSFTMGKFAGTDPSMISALVMIANDAIALRQVEKVATIRGDESTLADLRSLLRKHHTRNGLWFYLRGESIYSISYASLLATLTSEELQSSMDSEEPVDLFPGGVSRELAAKAYRTRILQVWTGISTRLRDQTDEYTQSKMLADYMKAVAANPDLTYQCFKLAAGAFDQFGSALVRRDANLVTVDALLATLDFRARQGRFPTSLEEAGVTALDPFTQKPLKMKAEKDSVAVWSVGENLKDDGGEEKDRNDVVARYPRN